MSEGLTMSQLQERNALLVTENESLKAQRDALAENEGYKQAFYEMAEILGIGARADSPKNVFEQVIKPMLINLQKERDQLAAENAAIKTMNDVLSEELRGYESDGAYDGPNAHKLWHSNSETPATDAYLNSVRADTLTRIINTGEFSNWVNQGLQVWVNRFNANSDVHLCAGKDGE